MIIFLQRIKEAHSEPLFFFYTRPTAITRKTDTRNQSGRQEIFWAILAFFSPLIFKYNGESILSTIIESELKNMSKQYISQFQMPDGSIAHLKDADVPSVDTVLDKNSNNPISNAAVAQALEKFQPGENIGTQEVQYPNVPDMPTPYLIIGPEKIYEPIQDEWHDFSYPYTTGNSNWMTFGFMRSNGALDIRGLEIRHAETGELLYSLSEDIAIGPGAYGTSTLPHSVSMYYFGHYNNITNVGAEVS